MAFGRSSRIRHYYEDFIIGACSTDGTYEEIKEGLLRIKADREEKTETAWTEEKKKKIIGKMGMTCFRCEEKGHISRNWIQNWIVGEKDMGKRLQRKKHEVLDRTEKVNVGS